MSDIGYGFARSKRNARRIKNLQISEVSSVDAAAGIGTSVVLLKSARYNERGNDTMTGILKNLGTSGIHAAVAKTIDLAGKGSINEHQIGTVQKSIALAMFPAEINEGRALAKLFGTQIGMDLLKASSLARRPTFGEIEAEIAKASASAKPIFAKPGKPTNADGLADSRDDDDGGDDDQAMTDLNAMATEHRRRVKAETGKGMTHDAAVVAAISTPEGHALFQRAKANDLRKSTKFTAPKAPVAPADSETEGADPELSTADIIDTLAELHRQKKVGQHLSHAEAVTWITTQTPSGRALATAQRAENTARNA